MDPRTRYGLYAGATILAAAAYVMFDDPLAPDHTGGPTPATVVRIALPELTATNGNDTATVARDLFKVVAPAPAGPPPVVAAAPEPSSPPPPPPDRLADLKVIGVVMRGTRLAILIEQGEEVSTVEAGQQFGKDEALSIEGIEHNRVHVTDKLANVTKTFTLSEE